MTKNNVIYIDDYAFSKSLDDYQEQIYFRRLNDEAFIQSTRNMIEEMERKIKLQTVVFEGLKERLEVELKEFHEEYES